MINEPGQRGLTLQHRHYDRLLRECILAGLHEVIVVSMVISGALEAQYQRP
jgi:hypothetical protein